MDKKEIIRVLNINRELIEENNYEEFYNSVHVNRSYYTKIFLDSGINPLLYMYKIPTYYGAGNCGEEKFTIPKNITVIENAAFSYNEKLKEINFSEDSPVIKIPPLMCARCFKLEKINFPKNLISIGKQAFHSCNSLKEVKLPDQLEVLEEKVFENCHELKKIYLPKSLREIGDLTFPYSHYWHGNEEINIYYPGSEEEFYSILGAFKFKEMGYSMHFNSF